MFDVHLFLHRGCSILLQTVTGASRSRSILLFLVSGFWLLFSFRSPAILDINTNGLSDIWEKSFNNDQLYPGTFDPQADPDGDGWNNVMEAIAGTDPDDANPPDGLVRPETTHHSAVWGTDANGNPVITIPESLTQVWVPLIGKQYTMHVSADLAGGSWLPVGEPFIGNGNEVTYAFPINGGNRFWRVAVTDVDSDDDGLSDYEENQLGTDPTNDDTDGDGISDKDEAIDGTDPTKVDTDEDGLDDNVDADPKEILVDWEKTPVVSYVLIEIEGAEDHGYFASDLNDKGEVLFDDAIWAGGEWIEKIHPEISGVIPGSESVTLPEGITYDVGLWSWRFFNNDRKLLQVAGFVLTSGGGTDGGGPCPLFWPDGQSTGSLIYDTADLWEDAYWNASPLGISASGEVLILARNVVNGITNPWRIDRFDDSGVFIGSMDGADGYHPAGGWQASDITPSGWFACNLEHKDEDTGITTKKVGFWDADSSPVTLPAEADSGAYPVRLAGLPNQKVALVAGSSYFTGIPQGRVFLPDADGNYQYASGLSSHRIQLFAGDGTAMTEDGKLWRNGKLIPMRDLCKGYRELEDDGYSFFPLKANKGGVYLIQSQSPSDEIKNYLAVPAEFNFVDPDNETWSKNLVQTKVILKDKNLRIKLKLRGIEYGNWIELRKLGLATFEIEVPDLFPGKVTLDAPGPYFSLVQSGNDTEIRLTLSPLEKNALGIAQDENQHDGVQEWASADIFVESNSGNLDDSKMFKSKTGNLGFPVPRGYSTDEDKKPDFDSSPTLLRASKTFMQAGGAMVAKASIPDKEIKTKGLIANQADFFYYSGHGVSEFNGHGYFDTRPETTSLGDLSSYWNGDLDLLIIAGCSLCNINNWVANPLDTLPVQGPHAGYSPGKELESFMAAEYAVGYGGSAPSDNGGASIRIIEEFLDTWENLGSFGAWKNANSSNRAWNATAIKKLLKYGYFKKSLVLGIEFHEWTEVPKEQW